MRRPVVIVAGPTASGKSALAFHLAQSLGGTIINADSMQVYRELPVLTAQPEAAALAQTPHELYAVLPAAEPCSAGRWRGMAEAAIARAEAAGRLPIVAGGTGLYLRALMRGLTTVPLVPEALRAESRRLLRAIGSAALHRRLAPADAALVRPSDSQRVARAYEVLTATGRALADWRGAGERVAAEHRFLTFTLLPERTALYAAADRRFMAMLDRGALDEAARLWAQRLDPALPAMKALGVPELLGFLAGQMPLSAAIVAAQQATRHYAKRQYTWFRHQLPEARILAAQYSERVGDEILQNVRNWLLTPPE